jgi:hypothetical protein
MPSASLAMTRKKFFALTNQSSTIMINTETYATKEFTPAPSAHVSVPSSRMRRPIPRITRDMHISDNDLDFLTDFIKVSAYYVEDLEDHVGEELMDFWESREHALQIITDLILQKTEQEESY